MRKRERAGQGWEVQCSESGVRQEREERGREVPLPVPPEWGRGSVAKCVGRGVGGEGVRGKRGRGRQGVGKCEKCVWGEWWGERGSKEVRGGGRGSLSCLPVLPSCPSFN